MTTSRPTERSYRLAPMQHGMLFHTLSAPDDEVYVTQIVCELPRGMDLSAFKQAWQSVINRHEVLRTCLSWDEIGEPIQKVCEDLTIQIDIEDMTSLPPADRNGLLESYLLRERKRSFDLSTAPLMRFAITKIAGDKDLFVWTYHHMLLDGRAMLIVMKEVSLFYEAYCSNQNLELSRPSTYADYIDWFYRQNQSDAEQYWRKLLGTFTTPVKIDLPRESDEEQSGDRYQAVRLDLSEELKTSLQQLAQSQKLTVNWIMQAAWAVLLARYSGQEDVVYGETRSGRRSDYEEVDSVVGLLINTVPIRLQATATRSFIELLEEVRDQHVEMRAHECTPLTLIREASGIDRTAELFHSVVVFEGSDQRVDLREGCALWRGDVSILSPVHYPLSLIAYSKPDLSIRIDYDRWSYSDEVVERLARHLTTLLEGAIKDPLAKIADLPLLTNAERQQIVYEWNATESEYPRERCVHELFEAQVEKTPDAVAVVYEDATLSYGELNRRADQLAHHLRGLGVGPDARVAICVERSLEMVVGLLGIMKAGAAYVPLDPAYPAERLSYMVEDSSPAVVLTQTALLDVVNSVAGDKQVINIGNTAAFWNEVPAVDQYESNGVSANNLAYLIYTSGSTGSPKGVAIEHRNANALIHWAMKVYTPEELDGVLAATSICFDLSVFELFVTLSRGGKVLLVQDALELVGLPHANAVTLVNTVPSAMAELVRTGAVPASVSTVNLAGEPLQPRLVDQIYEQKTIRRVIDLYGPSEATTYSTYGLRRPLGPATIGRPIANTQVYVLDNEMQPVPVGVIGELYIGGDGLARCYLDRAVSTAEKWIPDPLSGTAGGRVYKTGDLGKWRTDGTLEFVGRNDLQVKVRGYRIELGEIELALMGHEQVREAVVIARDVKADQKQLVAYYTTETGESEIGAEHLREHLLARLPQYMVPAAYVWLEKLPLTPNGKLDRKRLPAPDSDAYVARGYEEPVGHTERALAGIWSEVLKVERVGRRDNFFDLGGHSLLGMRFISQVRHRLGVEALISDLFAHPDLAGFAHVVERAAQTTLPAITVAERGGPLPLSFAQQRLWFLAQMEGGSQAYHIPWRVQLRGKLDHGALRRALDRIVARHEVLRTVFVSIDGDARQWIHSADESSFHLIEHDLREQTDAPEELERVMAQEASASFDLGSGPMIRGRLIRLGEEEHALLITMHHIVSDGWSMEVLIRELSALYGAFARGEEDPLPELEVQYADYAVWQRQWMEGELLRQQAEYWERRLSGAPTLLELPTDHPRPAEHEYAGGWVTVELDEELSRGLKELSKKHGTTLYMTLLAGWAMLLARLSGQEEVVIGTPVANRGRVEIEGLIGFFVNMLALRLDVSGAPSVGEMLERVKEQTLAAQQHQDIPFERVVEVVHPARSLSHSPIFQVMFAWQNASEAALELPQLEIETLESTQIVAKFDLTLSLQEADDRIVGGLRYATALYEQATVERYSEYFRRIVKEVIANPESSIRELPLLSEAERNELLVAWNATESEYPRDRCVHELFEAQVEKTPDAIAVVYEDATLSYGELNRRANQLAHHLRELGVGPDQRVAICVERSLEMIVGLIAVLKAGGAYVPLDPAYPVERLQYMLDDSSPAVLLTQMHLRGQFDRISESLRIVDLKVADSQWSSRPDTNPDRASLAIDPQHLAYLIYTSGTTGLSKGVMIYHQSVVNLFYGLKSSVYGKPIAGSARVSVNGSLSFDTSVKQIIQLLDGHTLEIIPEPIRRDSEAMLRMMEERKIDVFDCTPSQLHLLLEEGLGENIESPSLVLVGGEAIEKSTWERLANSHVRFFNVYGPTECTVDASITEVRAGEEPSLGRPIANTTVYVLDEDLNPVPRGVAGELCIGGDGVGRGYWKHAETTAEKFIANPFETRPGSRLYKTGDLVCYLPDGNIKFLGRIDQQVKLRGYRIEPGEVEARLREYPGIVEAAVVAQGESEAGKRLVAYYTGLEIGAKALRDHLSLILPEYMVPVAYVHLESLPLLSNGKLNRRALPAPGSLAFTQRAYEPAVGQTESELARIWGELLKVERVGRQDNFFELGGHSLLVVRVISRLREALNIEVMIRDVFEHPVLADLAAALHEAGPTRLPAITPAPDAGDHPLSFAQQRLWFLAQMGAGEAYHIFYGWRLKGALEREALRRALDRIVARHEALRTTFIVIEGEPVQRIAPVEECPFHLLEHDLIGASDAQAELDRLATEEEAIEFDLEAGPLIRGRLVQVGQDEHALLITMHHIVSDGWSMDVLMNELSVLYAAFVRGVEDPLRELEVQYADYAVWQRQWMEGEMLRHQAEYWERTLSGAPALLELPMDHARPAQQDYAGGWVALELDEELTRDLNELSKKYGTTLYMTLLAGWSALLARLSGQEEIVVGVPVANRGRMEIEGLIGFFVNTLALRLDVSGSPSVGELLERVKEQTLLAQQHQDIPFEQVVEIVRPVRSLSHSPIFQVMFAWQNAAEAALELPQLEIEKLESTQMVAKFDLTLSLQEAGERIVGGLKYATALYEPATVERYSEYFRRILREVVANPESSIGELPLLSEAERDELLVEWNATEAEYPRDRCVHELFEQQVEKTPDAVAVVYEDATLSYGELNRRANQLAHHLRELGVGPDERVAVYLDRSVEMIVGLLAVLKAGGAYLPLDPAYPSDRLRYIVEDSAPAVLLKERHREAPFTEIENPLPIVDLTGPAVDWSNQPDSNPQPSGLTSSDLAYVIYTSGSTGTPKGVVIEHHSLVNLISWHCASFELTCGMRSSGVASFGFDAATWEIWPPLSVGATVLLSSPVEARDPEALLTWWTEKKPDISFLPTSIAEFALAHGIINPLQKTLLVGGDLLHRLPVKSLPFALINNYGPTETTVVATSGLVELSAEVPSIGRPIANAQVYILDEYRQPVPVGVQGELYIGGAGVARGYLHRPERTAERFVVDPFSEEAGARMYRTGDLGRWLADGTIEFLGRNDYQVKIRGYRIELGEIEARLAEYEGVNEAVVVVHEDAPEEKRLVAYYTCLEEKEIGAEELRSHLSTKLPKYMVPAAYVRLERLPLSPNGKVDRKGLPAPDGDAYGVRSFEAPIGETETVLARIWADALKVERVGRHDDFFELGGHSLRAMRFISQLRQALGVEVAISDLFAHSDLAGFALVVERAAQTTLPEITPAERGGPLPLSFAQQRIWFLAQMERVSEAYHIFYGWRLKGPLNYAALRQALNRIVKRHEALRTTFEPINGDPAQWIHSADESVFHLVEHDLREQMELGRVVAQEASATFDLDRGPLIRGRLIRLGEEEHALLITMHHIVSDGWSMDVLMNELSVLYAAFVRGVEDPLPELEVQYADYAVWQRQWMEGEMLRQQAEYWERTLSGAPALLELPMDHARPAQQDYAGGWVALELDEELTRDLNELSKKHGTTLYMTLLAGWSALLARLSGQEDIVVGVPVANRGRMEIEGLIGFFVNTLALRLDVSGSPSVGELLERVKEQTVLAQQHQDIPFEQVVEIVRPVRSLSHSPIFQVMFAWQNAAEAALELPQLEIEKLESTQMVAKFDLTLSLQEEGDRIVGGLKYATALYEPATVERYSEYFRRLLKEVVANPESSIRELPLLSEAERHELIVEWNATEAEYPRDRCVHELFEEQVEKTPDAVAVVYEDATLSYGELNRGADRLAHHLRGLGIEPDARVAICVERSLEMVVGLLGIMKAGAAYVPLDPAYPSERLSYMVQDSAPAVVLTQTALLDVVNSVAGDKQVINIGNTAAFWNEVPAVESNGVSANNLAYLIYTSGSTGSPKGVAIEHRNANALIHWAMKVYTPEELDGVLAATSICFDLSVFELFVTLSRGGKVLLVQDALELVGLPHASAVTLVNTVPSAMAELVRTGAVPASVGTVNLAGEPLQPRLVDQIYKQKTIRRVIDLYGPSEATTYSTYGLRHPLGPATIGRPIANTQVYVLDNEMQPVPVGVIGELYIGGDGLARCYLDRAVSTAEKWIPDPFSGTAGGRVYKTGDLGKWRTDGTLEFVGRNDLQVKVRGYRIELGEIELALMGHQQVREAVVIARNVKAEQKQLVAYYTTETGENEIGAEHLREHLLTRLPQYMVPAAYVWLEKLPLTPNGKLDRKRLPAPDSDAYVARGYEEPMGHTERALAGIWREVLKVERVGRRDNFFDLGGHSLLGMRFISQVRHRLGVEALISDLFAHPDLAGFAHVVERAAQTTLPTITVAERGGPLPLSFAQQRLWFLAQMGASEAYHVYFGWRLKGHLDRGALRRALDRILARHEALRTTFIVIDGQPLQRITAAAESRFDLVEHNLAGTPDAQTKLEHLVRAEAKGPFDLEAGPLIRGRLIRLDEDEHALLITMHHIVSDGWSMDVLIRELSTLYGAFARGEEDPLPELEVQYADYAVWQRQWMEGEILRQQGEYWERTLAGAPTLLELPTDHPRPAEQDYAGGWVRVELDEELSRGLKELSTKHGTTLYMTLLAGWGALLARLSGQDEVVIGTPVANRGRMEIEGLIGFFVNTLALRLDVSGSPSVGELLERVKEQTLLAQQHQDIPFEQVVEIVRPVRSLSHSPIFQAIFAWQNASEAALDLPQLEIEKLESTQMDAKFDLSLSLQEESDRIVGGLKYATALYEQATAERYSEYFRRLLKAVVANPDSSIRELPLLSEAERNELIVEWNATQSEYPQERCVHELFEEQVEKTPDAVAVVYEDTTLTYGGLNRRANRLAHHLLELGIKPGERVAMLLERSTELVVAQLAVLKCGAAYVPIDPTFPEVRQIMMVRDSGAVVAITSEGRKLSETLAVRQVEIGEQAERETNPRIETSSDMTAYVMYTSGSTGIPKGVMVPHRAIGRLVLNCGYASFNKEDRVAFASNPAFDASTMEVWGALLNGGSVVVVDREKVLDAAEFDESLKRHDVSVLWMTAGLMNQYAERLGETLRGLRYLIVGGDVLDARVMQGVLRGKAPRHLLNGYGPTETTTFALTHEISEVTEKTKSIPLGRPIANTQAYILDDNWEPTPVGVRGELYIGGAGVAEGYLNRPDLTAERFVPDAFGRESGERMYRTGDLGRWTREGQVEFEGRNDSQVKIRGFRIELGEIEARLAEHEGVKEAVVVAHGDAAGEKRLVAYYTPAARSDADNGEFGEEQVRPEVLRAELGRKLPEYMVPVAYVRLEKMPLTPNGKVDRRGLPQPEEGEFGVGEYEEPRGDVERTLAEIWAEVLKLERVGRHDNFFELGGHSLLVMSLMNRIRTTMGIQFSIRTLFEAPTVSDLAERLNSPGTAHIPLRPAMLQSQIQAE